MILIFVLLMYFYFIWYQRIWTKILLLFSEFVFPPKKVFFIYFYHPRGIVFNYSRNKSIVNIYLFLHLQLNIIFYLLKYFLSITRIDLLSCISIIPYFFLILIYYFIIYIYYSHFLIHQYLLTAIWLIKT